MRRKSIIWSFCTKSSSNDSVKCNICEKTMKYVGNTTNFRTHLRRRHNMEWRQFVTQNETDESEEQDSKSAVQSAISTASYTEMADMSTNVTEDEEFLQNNSFKHNRGKRSNVWHFFKKSISGKFVKCSLCHTSLKFCSNTSNLRNHLIQKHYHEYSNFAGAEPHIETVYTDGNQEENIIIETILAEATPKKKPAKSTKLSIAFISDEEKAKIDAALLAIIVKDLQPVSMAGSAAFLHFTRALQPLYATPTPAYIAANLLPELYSAQAALVKAKIEQIDYLSATIELWKSECENQPHLTFTVHFLDEDRVCSQVLETRQVYEDFSCENIAEILWGICAHWQLDTKIVAIVSNENEATVAEAIDGYFRQTRQPCIGNAFNSGVNEALEDVTSLVELVQTVSYHLRKNAARNSIWNMCLVAIDNVARYEQVADFLVESDWEVLHECTQLLKPLKSLAAELSRERFPRISIVIPLVRGVQIALKKQAPASETGRLLKAKLVEKVVEKLAQLETSKVHAIATFLDPRFKKTGFEVEANAEDAQRMVTEELAAIVRANDLNRAEGDVKMEVGRAKGSEDLLSVWSDFDAEVAKEKSVGAPDAMVALILRQYLELPHLMRTQSPVEFWHKNKYILPEMYRLYLKYLAIPATSAPSELMFFNGDGAGRDRRNDVEPEYLDKIGFLNSFYANNKV